jgi:GNAT superfamily N-acetyltransferase
MKSSYVLRAARVDDANEIATHRGLMFLDMGQVTPEGATALTVASAPWFADLLAGDRYKGWVVELEGRIVAGGGLHLSEIGPLPGCMWVGRSAHIANVYTHAEHRRQGIAQSLMNQMLSWCRESKIDQVTLTASVDGRSLYTALGFVPQPDSMLLKLQQNETP